MNIRIAGLVNDSIVDGPGFRLTVFTQGCPHHCPGCHNPQTHDPAGGHVTTTEEIIAAIKANPLLDGVTFSGGEPFMQSLPCLEIARAAHEMHLNVWAYSGWTFEQLQAGTEEQNAFLREVDVLVDGPFILSQRSLELKFRGSRNQRLIRVQDSIAQGSILLYE